MTGYRSYLDGFFAECRPAATITNTAGIHNQEWDGHVYICTGPRREWALMWPALRHYG